MKPAARFVVFLIIVAALAAGAWLATRGTAPDRRNLDALVTVGGDVVRDVTHPALDLTRLSAADEMNLGQEIDKEARAGMAIGDEARTERYLNRIAAELAKGVERREIAYTVAVARSPEINAFAVAGGRVYVTEGMLKFVDSEAELAAVIGHEISHVDLRHCVERLQIEQATRKISLDVGALARLGYELMRLGFSEEQELAADANGALLAAGARYDPWQEFALFERFLKQNPEMERTPTRDPVSETAGVLEEAVGRYLKTHPPTDQRLEAMGRALRGRPDLWQGHRCYLGRANLAARQSLADQALAKEWIVRATLPPDGKGAEQR